MNKSKNENENENENKNVNENENENENEDENENENENERCLRIVEARSACMLEFTWVDAFGRVSRIKFTNIFLWFSLFKFLPGNAGMLKRFNFFKYSRLSAYLTGALGV